MVISDELCDGGPNNPASLRFIANPEPGKPQARFNDGAVDRLGRFWAGTLAPGATSRLYRLDPDLSVHTLATGIAVSNGIGWSPDNRTMYYCDSRIHMIYAYDFDLASGTITNRRAFVHTPDDASMPDGLTVDSEGFIWCARWGGWKGDIFRLKTNIKGLPEPLFAG